MEQKVKPAWREFERLIARIEKAMAPSGAIVKTPDRVLDKTTGNSREVDATIRYQVGTCPILITIECRDRTSIEDVTWIEQLVEKKRSIGASITVAVSSSGFTEPAIAKAMASGIEVRTLADTTADDFVKWLRFQNVVVKILKSEVTSLRFDLYDVPDGAEISPVLQELYKRQGPQAPLLIRTSDGKQISIEDFLYLWKEFNGSYWPSELPSDGTKVHRNLHQRLERGCFCIDTIKGRCDIEMIHVGIVLFQEIRQIPVSRFVNYAQSPNVPLVQTAEWNLSENMKLSLHRDLKTGKTKGTLSWD